MNKNDLIELILDHMIQQGSYNGSTLETLQSMTQDELESELATLEEMI